MNTPQSTRSEEDRFEQRLRRIVSDGTDQRLAPPRTAPPFDPGDEPERPQRRWVVALVAAACALILAAGALVASGVFRSSQTLPADPAPTPALTNLGGARVALPEGWVVTPEEAYDGNTAWCLTPRVRPTPMVEEDGCPVRLISVGRPQDIASDNYGGFPNNGVPCVGADDPQGVQIRQQVESRTFGGRVAEWRRWDFRCDASRPVVFEQYIVKTKPAWIVSTLDAAHPEIESAITSIARDSQLPG